jgi:hypothetical protein
LLGLPSTLARPGGPGDAFEINDCSGQRIPVTFRIDCSRVTDPSNLNNCRPFLENTACKVFQAYRIITGVQLEQRCPVLQYTIYPHDQWPHASGGGVSYGCQIDYMEEYSVGSAQRNAFGPYDVHEILHHQQMALPLATGNHPLFTASMLAAIQRIGDTDGYKQRESQMRIESERLAKELNTKKNCRMAQILAEEKLAIADQNTASRFYRDLDRRNELSAEERVSATILSVSGHSPEIKGILAEGGCALQ